MGVRMSCISSTSREGKFPEILGSKKNTFWTLGWQLNAANITLNLFKTL